MTRRVGWYVHHHGRGHLTRLLVIAAALRARGIAVDCYSSVERPAALPDGCTWTRLVRDDEPQPLVPEDDPTVRGLLHWAPLRHDGHRGRLSAIVQGLERRPVDAFVVDVSVEVTLLVRLLGIPTVTITQPGDRVDGPHRLAFSAADRIIAPWPADLSTPTHLAGLGDRVSYVGGVSRFAGRPPVSGSGGRDVVLLGGGGGADIPSTAVADAERTTGRRWRVLGAGGSAWRADPWGELCTAGVVVSWCGQNAVADLAAAGASAVVIPQVRPFGEQSATADVLARTGLAVVVAEWPEPEEWPGLLSRAEALRPDWSRWRVDGAAERAAAVIDAVADAGAGVRG